MTPYLLTLLADPLTREPLTLQDAVTQADGWIESGTLVSASGNRWPIVRGVPRFIQGFNPASAAAFGDQWNHFNYTDFKASWLGYLVANTFGGDLGVFKDKVIIDAGGGHGAQSLWMLESGAKHVILMDLSHTVDDVVWRNIDRAKWPNFDAIQCSIDAPPLRAGSITGMVMCHNVIQHTPSISATATALFGTLAPGAEFVFNSYQANDHTPLRWVRHYLIFRPLRAILSRMPSVVRHIYANLMAAFSLIPILGPLLQKLGLAAHTSTAPIVGEGLLSRLARQYRAVCINTHDCYGAQAYQHYPTDAELRGIINTLQPNPAKRKNEDVFFTRPTPLWAAIRVFR